MGTLFIESQCSIGFEDLSRQVDYLRIYSPRQFVVTRRRTLVPPEPQPKPAARHTTVRQGSCPLSTALNALPASATSTPGLQPFFWPWADFERRGVRGPYRAVSSVRCPRVPRTAPAESL